MLKKLIIGVVVLSLSALVVWSSDRITMQGERTVYTVDCQNGTWDGARCSGTLVPGNRYAFRASPLRNEVIYWTRGSQDPSGMYSDCRVVDRDNWSCNVRIGQKLAIAYEMINGRPTHGSIGLAAPFHDVPKWKWWVLKLGIPIFSEADG